MEAISRMLEGMQQEFLDRMAVHDSTDNGELLKTGFNALSELVADPDAPQADAERIQLAFVSGAQYLWAAVMSAADDGKAPTVDMARMMTIKTELDFWQQALRHSLAGHK